MNQRLPQIQSDFSKLADLLSQRNTTRGKKTMVEFAETIPITRGIKKGGTLKLSNSPHIKRPLELASPEHICQVLILMWASQSGKSLTAQIPVCYYAKEDPREIIYGMTNQTQSRKVMNRHLKPMLRAVGVEFINESESKNTRGKGETTFSVNFSGGNLDAVTQGSSADLASESKGLAIADEAGDWNIQVGNQGNPYYQLYARLKSYLDEKKMIVPSTPGDEGNCIMESLFKEGTMEEWHVDCPLCGSTQILEVDNKEGYGLQWTTKKGRVIENSIVYVCLKCVGSWTEKKKFDVQQTGQWIPKDGHEPIDRYTYSLHFHSINSMFESWREIAKSYELGRDDPIKRKYYNNHVAGIPHRDAGKRMSSEAIIQNRGDYARQTVPDGVVYIVLGADVQAGAERWLEYSEAELERKIEKVMADAKTPQDFYDHKFPRIEFEVYGRGPAYRGWSIDYQMIPGKVENAYSGAWQKLYEWGERLVEKNGGFGFKREKDGRLFPIEFILIDSGKHATTVYDFCQRWRYTFPVKGDRILTVNKKDNHLHQSNFVPWKQSRVYNGTTTLYTISGKLYTKQMYLWLNIKRIDDDIQPAGFQDFPRGEHDDWNYGRRYFDMLVAEEKGSDGEYTNRGPNEAHDCRKYSMAAADIRLATLVEKRRAEKKAEAIKAGWKLSDDQIENKFNSRWEIEYLARKRGVDERYLVTKKDN